MIVTSIYLTVALALAVGVAYGFVGGCCWENGRKGGSHYWRHRALAAERERDAARKQRDQARAAAREDADLATALTADIDQLAEVVAPHLEGPQR